VTHADPIILVAVAYGGILLSIPILNVIGRGFLVRWLDRRAAKQRADLEAIERRHQAPDDRVYGEE
jgi:hypothetical protein